MKTKYTTYNFIHLIARIILPRVTSGCSRPCFKLFLLHCSHSYSAKHRKMCAYSKATSSSASVLPQLSCHGEDLEGFLEISVISWSHRVPGCNGSSHFLIPASTSPALPSVTGTTWSCPALGLGVFISGRQVCSPTPFSNPEFSRESSALGVLDHFSAGTFKIGTESRLVSWTAL